MSTRPRRVLIGLTGSMASGKSRVADELARLGAAVVDTDVISRQIMQPGSDVLAQVVAEWGADVLNTDGTLNRKRLGQKVFADADATARLNRLTHGAIMAEMDRQVQASDAPVVVAVIPLLFEAGSQGRVDEVWLVTAPDDIQVQRAMARDGSTEEEVRQRLSRQWPTARKIEGARVVIDNSATAAALRQAVEIAWQQGLERWSS